MFKLAQNGIWPVVPLQILQFYLPLQANRVSCLDIVGASWQCKCNKILEKNLGALPSLPPSPRSQQQMQPLQLHLKQQKSRMEPEYPLAHVISYFSATKAHSRSKIDSLIAKNGQPSPRLWNDRRTAGEGEPIFCPIHGPDHNWTEHYRKTAILMQIPQKKRVCGLK